jgi:hypothetical protein
MLAVGLVFGSEAFMRSMVQKPKRRKKTKGCSG